MLKRAQFYFLVSLTTALLNSSLPFFVATVHAQTTQTPLAQSIPYATFTRMSDPASTLTLDDADTGSWEAGSRAGLKQALSRQLMQCELNEDSDLHLIGNRLVAQNEWCIKPVKWFLKHLEEVDSLQELYAIATHELEWYKSVGATGAGDMLFTGYYYPEYKAKLTRDAVYKYPYYRLPDDLKPGVPYYTREQIVNGALDGRGLEIAYSDNPLDPYFLQVQGSGALLILDEQNQASEKISLHFKAKNNQPYYSLMRLMREGGVDESYSGMQGIYRYFKEHPEEWEKYSNQNPSYVFFEIAEPMGTSGAILTPKHSVAVDRSYFPMGMVGLIHTDRPARAEGDTVLEWKNFSQFVVAQDTGGAIKTPGRLDVYWGSGEYATLAAGHAKNEGEFYVFLLP